MQRVVFHEIKSLSVTQGLAFPAKHPQGRLRMVKLFILKSVPEQLCEHQLKTEF